MPTFHPNRTAERAGRWLGHAWRNLLRQEKRVVNWMTAQGLPPSIANVLVWMVKVTIVAALAYVAVWFALLLAFLVAAVWVLGRSASNENPITWKIGEQAGHRQSVFYDPINYNDTPDPRFDGQ